MKIKKIIVVLLITLLTCKAFSQSEEIPQEEKKSFLEKTDFVLQFEPAFYLSPESSANKSNTINALYPVSIGFLWPNDYFIAIQPTISFFQMHHLLYNGTPLPAEIENRTTTTLAFMLNIPAVYTLKLKGSKFQFSAGPGIFLRFGLLSKGVNKTDPGYSGSAESDTKLINKWFWKNCHWLYLNFGVSWLYPITTKIEIGPVLNAFIPVGSLIDQHTVQGLMFSLGVKLSI